MSDISVTAPEASRDLSIEDITVFKLARLVSINERAGQGWSESRFGLGLNAWRVLALVQSKGPLRAGDLADLMLIDRSQLSRLLKQLCARGLVDSSPDPSDARAVVLRATLEGRVLHDRVMEHVVAGNERMLAPLSPEEARQFDEMLTRLTAHGLRTLCQSRA